MKRILIFLAFVAISFTINACQFGGFVKIDITREYVTNSNWGKGYPDESTPRIAIRKLIPIYPVDDYVLYADSAYNNLSNYFYIDTNFCFYKKDTDTINVDTIYFNRKVENLTWYSDCRTDSTIMLDVIGKLECNSWYQIGFIRYQRDYFIYVDGNGAVYDSQNYLPIYLWQEGLYNIDNLYLPHN